MAPVPDFLSHYYAAATGPFLNLSDLSLDDAERIQAALRTRGNTFASQRTPEYLQTRRQLEDRVRALFIDKGGQPQRQRPHYLILGACPWVQSWYIQGCELRIPLADFAPTILSFTYGDTFPAMRYQDGKPYRGQVYTLDELPELVAAFGLPQDWNADGSGGPDRYIEAQVWSDTPLQAYYVNQARPHPSDP
ncbi:hypothetical protein G4Y79_04180 [Phototrophicus methaneseepsis]|uniref:Uncharacterized protein n=1 Tax=Phototrophicus methaneseepsis TaxID=2710758 RepID=A0A7S8EB87_9CHLR|nr:hypothetical protein [Phototrophicus methaneseepsis]QPC83588.1 hypothetical protein G4Y79_04180 [Phototrophicus methaneseepsis]